MACNRVCHLPVIGEQPDYSGFLRKEFSRELTPQSQSREYSREIDGVPGSGARGGMSLPLNVKDAIVTLVQAEVAHACDPITSKLAMLQGEVDYMSQNIKGISDILPSGPLIAGIPDQVSDMNKKNTETVNAVAMHACRIQEAEQHIQEVAALQRELAATLTSHSAPTEVPTAGDTKPNDLELELRLAKLESEFGEYVRLFNLSITKSAPPVEEDSPPLIAQRSEPKPAPERSVQSSTHEPQKLQELNPHMESLQGDQGPTEMDIDGWHMGSLQGGKESTEMDIDTWQSPQSAPVQHEEWLAKLIKEQEDKTTAVDTSQIQLEERTGNPHASEPASPNDEANGASLKIEGSKNEKRFGMPKWLGFRRGSGSKK